MNTTLRRRIVSHARNRCTRFRAGRVGFTLIETLMAILVLTVAIAGPLTIASRGLNEALIAKDQTIAFYLAQDAIEFVRFQRDTNELNSRDWLYGLDMNPNSTNNCVSSDGSATCTILSIGDTVTTCPGNVCPVLNYDKSSNVYTYTAVGGTIVPTIFTRSVSIVTPVCDGGAVHCNSLEAQVQVVVSWKDVGSVQHKVNVSENLLKWIYY